MSSFSQKLVIHIEYSQFTELNRTEYWLAKKFNQWTPVGNQKRN